jgi:hypothetical protein
LFHPVGKAGGRQIQRCQGIAVKCDGLHPWRLGADTLCAFAALGLSLKRRMQTIYKSSVF